MSWPRINTRILKGWPSFVGPLVGRITGPQHMAFKHLAPIIQERKASRAEYGFDYPGRPVRSTHDIPEEFY